MFTTITAEDGHTFDCWEASPVSAPRAGVVILQEVFGVTDQLKSLSKRYADAGFKVLIPALFDRYQPSSVIPFDEPKRGIEVAASLAQQQVLFDIDAAVKTLCADDLKVGVIGFCWGGGLAVRSAQKLDIECAVSFYGTGLKNYLDSPLKAPCQGHFGTQDHHTPQELLDEVKDYLGDIEIFTYEAGHAFLNDVRDFYRPEAAKLAESRAIDFLKRNLFVG